MEEKTSKLTKKELKEEIKNLPPPSFNDPEKVQPKVVVPTLVSTDVKGNKSFLGVDEKRQKVIDPELIISKKGARIEKLHRPKKQKIFRQIFHYAKPHWVYLALALLFALINSVLELMIPILAGLGIDCIIGPGQVDYAKLLNIVYWLIGTSVGYALFRWLTNYTENVLCFKTAKTMREVLFKKLNKVPLKYIDGTSHGDLQSRMINDIEQITDGFLAGLTTTFDCLVSIVLTIYLMFSINVNISIVIVVLTPLSLLVTSFIAYRSNKYFRRQAKALGDISGNIIETLGNQKVVTAFNYQDRAIEKFEGLNNNLNTQSEKATFYSSLTNPFSRFINGIIYAIVAIMGTYYAVGGLISVGSISVLLSYANKYIKPFNEISDVFSDVQAAIASARRVFNVLDIEDEPSDEHLLELKRCNGNVELKNVSFSYSSSKKLIENLNVSVKKGQRVAIVGPTGCGKSTLINLLMRFYDINDGDIFLSNKSIYEIKRASLRNKYGMVLQESWLFSSTIRENIAYGKPDASMDEIIKASQMAHAHDFIMTLENGYDTVINESGDNLSQGQKQLICIARIMLTKPPMLILDEATSNIDTRTELYIQEAFNKMMEGRTSFVVAHRLSTIVTADIILVMNKGQIIEQGTHGELMEKKGFYYNLYNSQFSKY